MSLSLYTYIDAHDSGLELTGKAIDPHIRQHPSLAGILACKNDRVWPPTTTQQNVIS